MKAIDFSYFIERYNASEMDEEEEKWFKKEMEGNEDLHDEVELRKKTDMVLKEKDIMSLRNKLNVIEKQRENPASSVKFQKFHNIRNVAVLAGIVLLAGIALLSRGKPGNDEIIRRYYKPYEVVMISRSVNSATARDNFQHAVGYYHIKDYLSLVSHVITLVNLDVGILETLVVEVFLGKNLGTVQHVRSNLRTLHHTEFLLHVFTFALLQTDVIDV